jgi:histone H3/H4
MAKYENCEIPIASFKQIVQEVIQEMGKDIDFEASALEALQEAAEIHLVSEFQRRSKFATNSFFSVILIRTPIVASVAAGHDDRVTIKQTDMALARTVRNAILGQFHTRESYYSYIGNFC